MIKNALLLMVLLLGLRASAAVGDKYQLVTTGEQIKSGRQYMVVGAKGSYYYVMLSDKHTRYRMAKAVFGSKVPDEIVVTDANYDEFTMETDANGNYMLKTSSMENPGYLFSTNGTNLRISASQRPLTIKFDPNGDANVFINVRPNDTSAAYVRLEVNELEGNNSYFDCIALAYTPNVYLYVKKNAEVPPAGMTLDEAISTATVGKQVTITNDLIVVGSLKNDDGLTLFAKDCGQHHDQVATTPAGFKQFQDPKSFDQSNWVAIVAAGTRSQADYPIGFVIPSGSVTGEVTNVVNPEISATALPSKLTERAKPVINGYYMNRYATANFVESDGQKGYYFMQPKPLEWCFVTWGYYSDGYMHVAKQEGLHNTCGLEGKVKLDTSLFTGVLQEGTSYELTAIALRENGSWTLKLIAATTSDEIAGLTTLNAENEVVAEKYYDLYGRLLPSRPGRGLVVKKTVRANGAISFSKELIR